MPDHLRRLRVLPLVRLQLAPPQPSNAYPRTCFHLLSLLRFFSCSCFERSIRSIGSPIISALPIPRTSRGVTAAVKVSGAARDSVATLRTGATNVSERAKRGGEGKRDDERGKKAQDAER